MKKLFFLITVTVMSNHAIAQIEGGDTLKKGANFYDFVQFIRQKETPKDLTTLSEEEREAILEGSHNAYVNKMAMLWEDRLAPWGDCRVAGHALSKYFIDFNNKRLSGERAVSAACNSGNWQCLGPSSDPGAGTGQMAGVIFSPNYATDKTVYAISNWGGVWRSVNGAAWTVLNTDTQLPITSVSDLAIDPNNPRVMYITTGEGENSFGHHATDPDGAPTKFTPLYTAGVYRTIDGGQNWLPINGLNQTLLTTHFSQGGIIRRIIINPTDTKQLYIASSAGVFKTDDATASNVIWTRLLTSQTPDFEYKGLAFKPNDPNTVYASGVDIFRSTNSGTTWSSMTGAGTGLDLTALPNKFQVLRINIAVSPANADKLYAYITGSFIINNRIDYIGYIYIWGGKTWNLFSTERDNPPITSTRTSIVISSSDENEVYWGTTLVRGGKNITKSIINLSGYSTTTPHADVHGLTFEPSTNKLFAATDGGVYIKDLAQQNTGGWSNFSEGLQVSTTWGFDDSEIYPDRFIIGNQDCGSYIKQNGKWSEIIRGSGDGFNGRIDDKTGLGFAVGNTNIATYDFDTKTTNWNEYSDSFYPQEKRLAWMRGNFAMKNHPKTEKMIFTMTELYERQENRAVQSTDTPTSLWKIKSDMGRKPGNWEQWVRQLNTFDISLSNPDYVLLPKRGQIYDTGIGGFTIDPALFLSTTGGCIDQNAYNNNTCFSDITQNLKNSGLTNNAYLPINPTVKGTAIPIITGVTFHAENHLKAWVCFTGYQPDGKVWTTSDGGSTWQNADPNLTLSNLPVNDIVYQKDSNEMVYVATDAGIYYKDASISDWKRYCDFPNVRTFELKINYCLGKLRACTFGRGIWEGDLIASGNSSSYGIASSLVIDANTTWNKSRGLDRNLHIKKGSTLKIEGTAASPIIFSMPKNGTIYVEDGAKLEVTNAILTNACGYMWQGIEAWGDATATQLPKLNTPNKQSIIKLTNATIEYANNAITTWRVGDLTTTGAIISAINSKFINNTRSVE